MTALGKLKKGKVGGKTGIPPELIAYGEAELFDRILELMREVWEERKVVNDWKDAEIIQSCDNWRGISLLDVVDKIFARIIQEMPKL